MLSFPGNLIPRKFDTRLVDKCPRIFAFQWNPSEMFHITSPWVPEKRSPSCILCQLSHCFCRILMLFSASWDDLANKLRAILSQILSQSQFLRESKLKKNSCNNDTFLNMGNMFLKLFLVLNASHTCHLFLKNDHFTHEINISVYVNDFFRY